MFADEHNKAFWLNSHKLGATLIDRWGYKESLLVYRDCISQSDKELNITHTKPTILANGNRDDDLTHLPLFLTHFQK